MSCCNPITIPFFNKTTSTVSYGPALQLQFGSAPNVTVTYWDGTQYVAAGIMTQIKLVGYPVTQIEIDHGGMATGLIKIR
jgi:hypothetical protein